MERGGNAVLFLQYRASRNSLSSEFLLPVFASFESADEYAKLNRELFQKHEHNRDGYTIAKGAFIKEITKKTSEE